MKQNATVILVDDEIGMLTALTRLLEVEGFKVRPFLSAGEYLAARVPDEVSCLVLDLAMPDISGLELQSQLNKAGDTTPVIFLTGHGDIPMSVRAIKSGAIDFLIKPVEDTDLLRAVNSALDIARTLAVERAKLTELKNRMALLTPREFEVFKQVISGKPNKLIASDLGTVEQTVKIHRMRMMEKMGVTSVVELVEFGSRLGISKSA